MEDPAAARAVEAVARDSYGRLLAYLSARSGDVAGAEDALSEAFVAALEKWPRDGVPGKPEAWLLQTARNRLLDEARHQAVRARSEPALRQLAEEAEAVAVAHEQFPDERLKLLFVCAHPAIEPAARTPLMLQTVLGIGAERIASAFLVSPAAMSQRLVRAKGKIRAAAIPFRVPEPHEWSERVTFVLDAIYSAFTAGWESVLDESALQEELVEEAISLGRTLVGLMPAEPEAHGLLALMLHCQARRSARVTERGAFVPLDRQDPQQWSGPLIAEAEAHLRAAAELGRLGRYQLEAAIQSIHAHRAVSGTIDWPRIALLYEGLVRSVPGIGARIGRAVALAQAGNPSAGLASLDTIPAERVASYQPYWAARAHLLELLDRRDEARESFSRAASFSKDPAVRAYLIDKLNGMEKHKAEHEQFPH